MKNKTLAYVAIVLGVVLLGLSVMYWTIPAGALPHFVPGYLAGSTVVHFKHGLASLILGLALFAYAWFQTGKKKQ